MKVPLPAKQHSPTPFPVRGAISAPSAEAVKLEKDHINQVSKAWAELIKVLDGSAVFKASKAKRAVAQGAAVPPKSKKARARKPKAPSHSDRAVEGAEFEEDGIDWKVLAVLWCELTEAVVAKMKSVAPQILPFGHIGKIVFECLFDEDPKEILKRYLEDHKIDLLIIATRKSRPVFESSFSHYFCHHGPCSVLVKRPEV